MDEKQKQVARLFSNWPYDLPLGARFAIAWIVKNIDLVDKLLENSSMTDADRNRGMAKALERRDYKLWALLQYQRFKQVLPDEAWRQ